MATWNHDPNVRFHVSWREGATLQIKMEPTQGDEKEIRFWGSSIKVAIPPWCVHHLPRMKGKCTVYFHPVFVAPLVGIPGSILQVPCQLLYGVSCHRLS